MELLRTHVPGILGIVVKRGREGGKELPRSTFPDISLPLVCFILRIGRYDARGGGRGEEGWNVKKKHSRGWIGMRQNGTKS